MSPRSLAFFLLMTTSTAFAQDSYKLEALADGPPDGLSPAIKGTLEAAGHRVLDAGGAPLVDVWMRKATPAAGRPAGPKNAVLYPVLTDGELLGAVRFAAEGQDYRDQGIPPGVYTMRYGLQPINGDHLGVSVNRDYVMLLPAAKDKDAADMPRKQLEKASSESVGSSHPGVLILLAAPAKPAQGPTMVHDETLNTWGAVLTIPLQVQGEAEPVPLPVQLVVVGAKTD